MDFGKPMISAALVYEWSFACPSSTFLSVSSFVSYQLVIPWWPARALSGTSCLKYAVSIPFCLSVLLIVIIGSSSSRLVLLTPSFLSLDSASVVRCLKMVRWTTSSSNLISRNRHLSNFRRRRLTLATIPRPLVRCV